MQSAFGLAACDLATAARMLTLPPPKQSCAKQHASERFSKLFDGTAQASPTLIGPTGAAENDPKRWSDDGLKNLATNTTHQR